MAYMSNQNSCQKSNSESMQCILNEFKSAVPGDIHPKILNSEVILQSLAIIFTIVVGDRRGTGALGKGQYNTPL